MTKFQNILCIILNDKIKEQRSSFDKRTEEGQNKQKLEDHKPQYSSYLEIRQNSVTIHENNNRGF